MGGASKYILIYGLLAAQGRAQPALSEEAYRHRIETLERRVASLERAIEQLTAARLIPQAAPAPLPATVQPVREMPPELVPDIGKIGAQVGLLLSRSANPFKLNGGSYAAGYIDLPLFNTPRWMPGKLSYEILVGISQSKTTFNTTSNVAQVANLAVLNTLNPLGGLGNVTAAVTGTGPAPFPVTTSTQTRFRLLEVVPFAMKYSSSALDRWLIRPYGVVGFGTYVTIHNQNPARGNPPTFGVRKDATLPPDVLGTVGQIFGGQAPFGGALVAGQISQSPELAARGLPGGHGNFDIGLHSGAGFEYRVLPGLSFGFDARFSKIAGSNGLFRTYGSRIGLHF